MRGLIRHALYLETNLCNPMRPDYTVTAGGMLFTVLVVVSGFAHEVGIDSRQFAQQYMLRTWDIDNAFPL